jgi:hypothetical protein
MYRRQQKKRFDSPGALIIPHSYLVEKLAENLDNEAGKQIKETPLEVTLASTTVLTKDRIRVFTFTIF